MLICSDVLPVPEGLVVLEGGGGIGGCVQSSECVELEVKLTGSGGVISGSGSRRAIVITHWEEIGAFKAVVAVVSLATVANFILS